jgi:two-component system cell cycle response regulator DivK
MPGTDELRVATQRERPIVLIAEDERELRQLYAQQLTISGFDVIEAANGAEAIDLTSTSLPDVILMDLSMPVLDGWEATRRLRANTRTAHIPVVALTAHDGSGELQRATSAGCDWFVPKPCPPDALITEIRRILSAPRPPSPGAPAKQVPPSP